MTSNRLIAVGMLSGALCTANSSQADLIGSWQFEEAAGAIAANSVAGGADGDITNHETGGIGLDGSVWVNDPEFGSVISFNGAADGAYVRAGDLPVMDLAQDFTWAFLANNLQDITAEPNNIIVGNRYDGVTPGVDFVPRQFTKFTPTQFEYHMNDNGNDNLNYDDLPIDQWNHHAVVKEGDLLTYYRNGVAAGMQTITQPQDVPMPLYFGGDSLAVTGENWHGLLDDVRIYDNALSADEVVALLPPQLEFVLGDVNGDRVVTIDDFEPIRANFLQSVVDRTDGDLNRDKFVDFDDFNEFKAAFSAAGGSLEAAQTVPEPSTGALLVLLTAVGAARRRR